MTLPFQSMLIPLLIFNEGFHLLAHTNVFLRLSPPPASTLQRRGLYFLWDGLSHLAPYFVHGRFLPYIIVEFIAHMFYTLTWNRNYYYTERIKAWSTKEYTGRWVTYDFFLTLSDMLGHSLNIYALNAMADTSMYAATSWLPFVMMLLLWKD
eukprot:TRINITY_DN2646_c0_g1_i2.p1 TRINITY_DN2646_c0_g1~~TRINITY_DN2646_c0_g1_i2.p1  ORF type:complete len:152 (+),score=44.72 TRINITY_DN2646_c0_g1_i2:49-504(+)